MGGKVTEGSRNHWWMVEGASPVVVPGTYLQLGGYHATDARRGQTLSDSRQTLERNHETHI